jgi:hypothetical protein
MSSHLVSSRERHSRASQCGTEVFWKKKPTRTESYPEQRPHKGSMQLKSRIATEKSKGKTLQQPRKQIATEDEEPE